MSRSFGQTVALLATLTLAPLALGGTKGNQTALLPLDCDGSITGTGHVKLAADGDLSGSIKLDAPITADGPLFCTIYCNAELETQYGTDTCAQLKQGHRTVSFKLKDIGARDGIPARCNYPIVKVTNNGSVFCFNVWVPRRPD
ncbi:MAG TPA: hypothetical protein VMR50_13115 [Myxococcota bacterium]|nr:hypothetical protein [Myxococcota bacterium]